MGWTVTHDCISPEQRDALRRLAPLLSADYYLAGGVAVAAHLGHRRSVDLDLFTPSDPTLLRTVLEGVGDLALQSISSGTVYARLAGVPFSMIRYGYPLLEATSRTDELQVPFASITDLACMKLSAISNRGAARDFWDLHAIVTATGREVSELLVAYQAKYPVEDVGHVVRSLGYFADAEAAPLPMGLSFGAWKAIRADVERWARSLVA